MAAGTRTETIAMPDGGEMGAYVALPQAGHGPGLLVLMEIFGVSTYIRRAAERLAELGYVALAPDLFRRTHPGLELGHDQAGLEAAMQAMSDFDPAGAVQDSIIALEYLRGLEEVDGPVGVVGFCLGGSLAFGVAAESDPAVAVCYYGSTIADSLHEQRSNQLPGAVSLRRPGLLHPARARRARRRGGGAATGLGVPHPARRGTRVRQPRVRDVPPAAGRSPGVGPDAAVPRSGATDSTGAAVAPRGIFGAIRPKSPKPRPENEKAPRERDALTYGTMSRGG